VTVAADRDSRRGGRFLLRYLVVGTWNTLFGIAVFTALQLAWGDRVNYLVVLSISQVVGVIQAHATQRFLVWRSKAPYLVELGRFGVVYLGSYIANAALLAFSVELLHAPVLPSQYVITVAVVAGTFVANRSWAFAHRDTTHTDGVAP